MQDFNPSGFLFPLTRLSASSTSAVEDAVEKLALVYSKGDDAQLATRRHGGGRVGGTLAQLDTSLRTSRRVKDLKQEAVVDSGYASSAEEDDVLVEDEDEDYTEALQLARNDTFEKEFTVRWLTGFIARSSLWTFPEDQTLSDEEVEEREALVEKAASLLSACSAISSDEEALTRDFSFSLGPSGTGETIDIELNDLLAPEDHSSVGLQSWASAIHFARMMSEIPSAFDIEPDRSQRILELGAGTGMLSIAAAKIIHALGNETSRAPTEIIATDYHTDVLANLQRNVDTNFASGSRPAVDIYPLDWQHPSWEQPFDAPFDVILAADVVYDPCHAGWIKDCVSRLLKKPSPTCPVGGVYWMIIALRNIGRHEGLAAAVFDVFPTLDMDPEHESAGLRLKTVEVRNLERSGGVGRVDESGYRLFKICWA